jgi:hypothetical protein
MLLGLLARFWPYVAIAMLGFGLYASVKHSGKIEGQLDVATEVSNAKDLVIDQINARHARTEAIVAGTQKTGESARKTFAAHNMEIANAPLDQDGPLAPVLRRELDRLRAPGSDAPGDGAAGAAAGGPQHLPGSAAAPRR